MGVEADSESAVGAEGINLAEGRTMLNRRADAATALIVAKGVVKVGVADDDAELRSGDGVLLPAAAVYSLQGLEESLVLLFTLSELGPGPATGTASDSGA
jgi:quercetin dioxygenase-like cupin family protein